MEQTENKQQDDRLKPSLISNPTECKQSKHLNYSCWLQDKIAHTLTFPCYSLINPNTWESIQ